MNMKVGDQLILWCQEIFRKKLKEGRKQKMKVAAAFATPVQPDSLTAYTSVQPADRSVL